MNDIDKEYWTKLFDNVDFKPKKELWLNKYFNQFPKGAKVLDLGVFHGFDTENLLEHGFDVVSIDFVPKAIEDLKRRLPQAKGLVFDMLKDDWNIFKTDSFDAVTSNLSLHYFSVKDTKRIIGEIQRILKPRGLLLARVNSTTDIVNSMGDNTLVEENFYISSSNRGSNHKRYFSEGDVKKFFSPMGKVFYQECESDRGVKKKIAWEIHAINKKG